MEQKERQRLRDLAARQMEIANSPKNLERVVLWKRHNAGIGERPTIHVEVGTFALEAIQPLMQCESEDARSIEYQLIHNFINQDCFDDDMVTAPFFQIGWNRHFELFGHRIRETILKKEDGTELGHHFDHIISDLEEDFDKITSASTFGVDKEATLRRKEQLEELFGDILPVKITNSCLYAVPTQQVVHMMGLENMLYAMYDYPDLFKEMMDRIASAYIDYFKYLESEGVLLQNHGFEGLAQGSLCFWDEEEKEGPMKTTDLWGFMDSQETVGISPEMFHEFIFPCYARIAPLFGRLSYGCCEPVHTFWDDIKTLPNLKKVSISPWCDEAFMAERLRGTGIVYLRKPSPNFLGVGAQMDEEAFRDHIRTTIRTARGCNLEIAQRDVYTVNRDMNKVRRYVQIIREVIEEDWQ